MPIIRPETAVRFGDFPFNAYGVHFYAPNEPLVERHHHDCDEAWVVICGRARVNTDGLEHIVAQGDIVWTRMGDDHELLEILEYPYGHVWMEGPLRGEQRQGHLHR